MNILLKKVVANIPRAITQPRRAGTLVLRRFFPYRALSRDVEAYQAVSSWTFGNLERVNLKDVFPGAESQDVHVRRALDRGADAGLSSKELLALAAITSHLKPRRILEIGTFDGNTALNFASNAPDDAVVTTVDLPPDWDGKLSAPGHMMNVTGARQVGIQFAGDPLADKIVQVFGDSATMDWSQLGEPFDLIFIDGCHYYDYVVSDTKNALAALKPDGVIIWHDYGIVQDVSRAVDEAAAETGAVAILGTRIAIGRRQET